MKNATAILATLFVLLGTSWRSWASDEILMMVSGEVVDATSGEPIKGALVSAPKVDVSSIMTDEEGVFKFFIPCSAPVEIKVEKEGYKTFERILEPQSKVELALKLERSTNQLIIEMTKFVSRKYIEGKVENLSRSEYERYKIMVYILTDKWYIHPFAVGKEGQGYAGIKSDGKWRIKTVFRGYQSLRVAFLLTNKSTFAPGQVEVFAADPDGELLSRIETVASLFIEAPDGI